MVKNISVLILLALSLFFFSCHKDNEYDVPMILMGNATDIDSTGVTLNFRITDLGKTKIEEYGVLWAETFSPNGGYDDVVVIHEAPAAKTYSVRISRSLIEKRDYYAYAYIRTAKGMSRSPSCLFTSLASSLPEITAVVPASFGLGDSIWLTGNSFDKYYDGNYVFFTDDNGKTFQQAKVLSSLKHNLKVVVPNHLKKDKVRIVVANEKRSSALSQEFSLNGPVIESISSLTAQAYDTLVVKGFNFSSALNGNRFGLVSYYGDFYQFSVVSSSSNVLKVVVPATSISYAKFRLIVNNRKMDDDRIFTFKKTAITGFYPQNGKQGDTICITGQNFGVFMGENTIKIGTSDAKVVFSSQTLIKAVVPQRVYSYEPCLVKVEFRDNRASSFDEFYYND